MSKLPLKFILASGNPKKAAEFSELFSPEIIEISPAASKLDVIENGTSYWENALLKAKAYFDHFGVPSLSDDSGLNVALLPGELGIHSARFGGEGLDDAGRSRLLLDKLDGISNRDAYFSCVLCFYLGPDNVYFFEGRLNGSISDKMSGTAGFGYDPVFIPEKNPGKSLSEDPEWKKLNSHRAQACKFGEDFFKD